MQGEGPKRLQLSATGPAALRLPAKAGAQDERSKAGDIVVTGDIEIMNKDLVICHLDEGAPFDGLRVIGPQHGTHRG